MKPLIYEHHGRSDDVVEPLPNHVESIRKTGMIWVRAGQDSEVSTRKHDIVRLVHMSPPPRDLHVTCEIKSDRSKSVADATDGRRILGLTEHTMSIQRPPPVYTYSRFDLIHEPIRSTMPTSCGRWILL